MSKGIQMTHGVKDEIPDLLKKPNGHSNWIVLQET